MMRGTAYIYGSDDMRRVILQEDVASEHEFRSRVRVAMAQHNFIVEFGPIGEPWSYQGVRRKIREELAGV